MKEGDETDERLSEY